MNSHVCSKHFIGDRKQGPHDIPRIFLWHDKAPRSRELRRQTIAEEVCQTKNSVDEGVAVEGDQWFEVGTNVPASTNCETIQEDLSRGQTEDNRPSPLDIAATGSATEI